jgi:hypothetical protein
MQQRPSQADSRPLREIAKDLGVFLHKTYAAESPPFSRADVHTQGPQRRQRLGHHPFATRFFHRRRRTVRDDYLKSLLPCGNSRRQPRRPSANYKHVRTSP